MIIIKLLGGLGNQMFQYAVAKVIADKHKTDLKFDLRGLFAGEDLRTNYELDVFDIPQKQAVHKEYFPYYRKTLFKSKVLWELIKRYKGIVMYKELDFTYNPNLVLKSTSNMLLRGLFQSEKYFINNRNIILKEFEFKQSLKNENFTISEEFKTCNSVAVHIRRGEFESDKKINNMIGTISLNYYKEAINYIKQNVKNPVFYIFSDSPNWVKENFDILKNAVHIDWNIGKLSYIDMQLMSLCKHNIIANSTFSWWAAWLNKHQNKIVIAPAKWFSGLDYNTQDLIPNTWIKL